MAGGFRATKVIGKHWGANVDTKRDVNRGEPGACGTLTRESDSMSRDGGRAQRRNSARLIGQVTRLHLEAAASLECR
jgi:hypothetical protein